MTEDEQSSIDHKEDKLTSVPKEEENKSNKSQEDIKEEEPIVENVELNELDKYEML